MLIRLSITFLIIILCTDIDECTVHLHTCRLTDQECVNTVGSFNCRTKLLSTNCPAGYEYNRISLDCEGTNTSMNYIKIKRLLFSCIKGVHTDFRHVVVYIIHQIIAVFTDISHALLFFIALLKTRLTLDIKIYNILI